MARVEYNRQEVDDNDTIEEAIIGQLRSGNSAEVAIEDLEKHYDGIRAGKGNADEHESVASAGLAEKCDAICTNLARVLRSPVEYNNQGSIIEFRMVTARPK
jgi:hypothetical protein